MTEAEWQECTDPVAMLAHLKRPAPDRKVRLYAVACCRDLWDLLPGEASRDGVDWAESFADGNITRDEDYNKLNYASEADFLRYSIRQGSRETAEEERQNNELTEVAWFAFSVMWYEHCVPSYENFRKQRKLLSVGLVHEIFGNPFRPVTLNPSWLTSTVVALATGIYDEKAFDRMPILADALQDAGCDNEDILNHLRGPGPHTKGCWALDLLTGRK
jgi:hypothetical protein